jgi:hypothetical protein
MDSWGLLSKILTQTNSFVFKIKDQKSVEIDFFNTIMYFIHYREIDVFLTNDLVSNVNIKDLIDIPNYLTYAFDCLLRDKPNIINSPRLIYNTSMDWTFGKDYLFKINDKYRHIIYRHIKLTSNVIKELIQLSTTELSTAIMWKAISGNESLTSEQLELE